MLRKLSAFIMALLVTMSTVPVITQTVLAAEPDYLVGVKGWVDSSVKLSGKDTYAVALGIH